MCKYAFKSANDLRGNCSVSMFNQNIFKQFVAINKEKCQLLFKFLSNVIALPTSEAIVESWGSSIDLLHKIKPHTKEVTDTLSLTSDTGTEDKTAFSETKWPSSRF